MKLSTGMVAQFSKGGGGRYSWSQLFPLWVLFVRILIRNYISAWTLLDNYTTRLFSFFGCSCD